MLVRGAVAAAGGAAGSGGAAGAAGAAGRAAAAGAGTPMTGTMGLGNASRYKAAKDVVSQMSSDFKKISSEIKNILGYAKKITDYYYKIEDEGFKVARAMALTRDGAQGYTAHLIKAQRHLSSLYGVTHKELAAFQREYSEAIGRNVVLSEKSLENITVLNKTLDSATASKIVDEFDKIGVGVEGATASVGLLQQKAKTLGVNPAKAAKMFADNIKLASKYSFKSGVKDIQDMALKSASLRMDMEAVMNAAEKFSTLEGSLETSANLQMLGGSFAAQFGNPMTAMYEATSDPKAFQDRLVKMVAGKGTYNRDGTVTFDPVTMRMMQEVAKQLGMSTEQLSNVAQSETQNKAIESELNLAGKAWSKEDIIAIQNLSRGNVDSETGKHQISWVDKEGNKYTKNIEELTKEELNIASNREHEMKDLNGNVLTIKDILEEMSGRVKDTTSTYEKYEGMKSWKDAFFADLSKFFTVPLSDFFNWGTGLFGKSSYAQGGVVPKAASGMVVPGSSYMGDKNIIAVNSGEMILNQKQQSTLFSTISKLAMFGGAAYGLNKMAGGGLGRSAIYASMLHGENTKASDIVSMHIQRKIFNKIIKSIKPVESSVKALTTASDNASKALNGTNSHVSKFAERWGKIQEKVTNTARSTSAFFNRQFEIGKNKVKYSKVGTKVRAVGRLNKNRVNRFISPLTNKASAISRLSRIKTAPLRNKVNAINRLARIKAAPLINKASAISRLSRIKAGKALSFAGKFASKAAVPIAIAAETISAVKGISDANSQYKDKLKEINRSQMSDLDKARAKDSAVLERNKSRGKAVGSAGGALAGMATGAAIGSIFGPVGTFIGGAIGGFAGSSIGRTIGKGIGGLFKGKNEEEYLKKKEAAENSSESTISGGLKGGLIGAAIGSMFGPIGMAVGGAIGGKIGSRNKAINDKVENNNLTQIISILRNIDSKIIDDRTVTKNNKVISNNIGRTKIAKEKNGIELKNLESIALTPLGIKGQYLKSIDEFDNKHINGKLSEIRGKIIGSYMDITPIGLASKKYSDKPLSEHLGIISPERIQSEIKANTSKSDFTKVSPNKHDFIQTSEPKPIKGGDFTLNVSGTIKLESGGKSESVDVKQLLGNSEFIRELRDIISKEAVKQANGGILRKENSRVSTPTMGWSNN